MLCSCAYLVVIVGFRPETYTVNEVAGSIQISVALLNGSLERDVTVPYFTSSGSATESGDLLGGGVDVFTSKFKHSWIMCCLVFN